MGRLNREGFEQYDMTAVKLNIWQRGLDAVRIAVCDDNEIQRDITLQTVREYLLELGDGSTIDTYSSGRELVAAVEQGGAYDVYIMDIIMPDFDGIETSKELRSMSPTGEIVFLTNSNEYAADSYGVGALYYLLKPIDKRKLYNVLQRAADRLRRMETAGMLVTTRTGVRRVLFQNIIYAERCGRIMRLHCLDGDFDTVSLRDSFKAAVAPLLTDTRFYLCGASCVLNLQHVVGVREREATLDNGVRLTLPRACAAPFRTAWSDFWIAGRDEYPQPADG